MSVLGRTPPRARHHRAPEAPAPASCYVCGRFDGDARADRVPSAWVYAASDEPADWPVAPICARCADEREPGDRALRGFVATRVASGSLDAPSGWAEAPPRLVRDGIDRLVRGLHHVLVGACAPAATTVVMGEPPRGGLAGAAEVFELGPEFRVQHLAVRLHHRWRITFFGAVTFHVVVCPPLSDALRLLGQEAEQSAPVARS